jgi:hypothetical protein
MHDWNPCRHPCSEIIATGIRIHFADATVEQIARFVQAMILKYTMHSMTYTWRHLQITCERKLTLRMKVEIDILVAELL